MIVQFDPASYTVEEGGVVNFRVVLVGNTNVPVTATFSTADGSAIGESHAPLCCHGDTAALFSSWGLYFSTWNNGDL